MTVKESILKLNIMEADVARLIANLERAADQAIDNLHYAGQIRANIVAIRDAILTGLDVDDKVSGAIAQIQSQCQGTIGETGAAGPLPRYLPQQSCGCKTHPPIDPDQT